MSCPRCRGDALEVLRERPEWTIHRCPTCSFAWRSTEPDGVTDADRRPSRFQLDPADIPRLRQVVPPPPPKEGTT